MLERLLEAYLLAQDNEFHPCIELKTNIDDGTLTQTAEQLMGKAFNFYKSCKDKGNWGKQSPHHQKVVAVSAELEKLKGGLKISDQLCNKLEQVQQRRQGQLKRRYPKDTKRNNQNQKNRQATVQRQ